MAYRTQRDLERLALPPGKHEVFHFDAKVKGLSVRIQRAGKPAFVVWYTAAGKRKRVTLGSTAGMDLEDARREANKITDAARQGRDPGNERKQGREAANGVLTLGGLVTRYLDHAARKQRPGTLAETKRTLQRHCTPLHDVPADQVTRRLVGGTLLDLTDSAGPIAANRTRAHLSACFMWGVGAGLVDHNPTLGTLKNEESSRCRVLSIPEIQAIWQATDDGRPFSAIIRLLLLTGQRKGEVSGMAWHEIDHERMLWSLPQERTKNNRPHEIPLSRQAYAILSSFPQREQRPYIFSRYGRVPFSGWSQCKVRLDDRIASQEDRLVPWTLHDLRRTFCTLAADHGLVEPHIIEAIVNHASGRAGVAGVYNRAAYREPKKLALQVWADWLDTQLPSQ